MKKLFLIALLLPLPAIAKSDPLGSYRVNLGRGATIVQCGHVSELEKVCKEEPLCCMFIDQGLENRMCEIYITKDLFLPVCVKVED